MNELRELSPEEFPPLLREIPDPPETLFLRGTLPSPELFFLSVVGSRRFTRYGEAVCRALVSSLRGLPVVVVSGLALGIDAIAHESALDVKLPTLAIPGSGLGDEVLYPRLHLDLAKRIMEQGGGLLSEYPANFKATTWSFPRRNRLMAGISQATLIIEAEEKSGTLITARLALDYNRDVLVVPGDIFSEASRGTNRLIRDGATPITSPETLWEALGFKKEEYSAEERELEDLTPEERILWELLREPHEKSDLFTKSELPIQLFNTSISLLEIKGLIEESLGEIRRKLS